MNPHYLKYQSTASNQLRRDKAKRIISFIFLFHFLCYAVTPLSYSFINNSLNKEFIDNGQHDTRNLHLYALDIIGSYIYPHPAGNTSNNTSDFILLRKKRAVLSESNIEKSLRSFCCALIDNHEPLREPLYINFSLFWDKENYPLRIFGYSFSGLSPPLA